MKKIIVTGGSGFIGSNLVNFLIQKNFFVINIDKQSYSSNDYNKILNKNYKLFKLDINNKKELISIIRKYRPKAIFNLAAETHVDRSIDGPKNFINSNFVGVFNLLEAIRYLKKKENVKLKLIHVSTDEVYGDIKKNERSNENFSYKPSSPYSATKAAADHLIKAYIRTYKIDAVISNCCNNYGPFQFPEKLIPKILYNIFNNKELPIYSKGHNIREWIYVKDHCDALYKLFLRGRSGQSYNVGSNINLKNIDLVKKILELCKKQKIEIGAKSKISFIKDRPGHDLRYALNSNKIKKEINWKNKTNINDGLFQTIKWYKNNKKFLKRASNKIFTKRLGLKV
tara:strand:+ start:2335 stop:3357 length:1023 start_codon:yes stop_codon:yes gene_type:complete